MIGHSIPSFYIFATRFFNCQEFVKIATYLSLNSPESICGLPMKIGKLQRYGNPEGTRIEIRQICPKEVREIMRGLKDTGNMNLYYLC
jgi:hypothetical protein